MKRNEELVELCKNLYVREQLTYKEIAKRVQVNERTVRKWKDRDGHWDREREAFLDSKRGMHAELYEFTRELISSIRNDLSLGEKIDQSRLSCIARILPLILKPKDYEETASKSKEEKDTEPLNVALAIAEAMEL